MNEIIFRQNYNFCIKCKKYDFYFIIKKGDLRDKRLMTSTATTTTTTASTTITGVFSQDKFLKDNFERKIAVYLQDGYRIVGDLLGFDQFTLTVFSQGIQQLIYKSAIANIIGLENKKYK
jgi:RNA chaperone Hfq